MATSDATAALVKHYDAVYAQPDYFRHDNALYRSFVAATVRKMGAKRGARVLDAGCGQGYLSRFLAQCQMNVWCADLSLAGLQSLGRYGELFARKRIRADITRAPFAGAFDVVFQRSCSLLNDASEARRQQVVESLIDCARVGGTICVAYNSNLRGDGGSWLNHTLSGFRAAFGSPRLTGVEIYAVNKLDCLVLGRSGFCRPMTWLNVWLSRWTGRCCEIVVFARRCR